MVFWQLLIATRYLVENQFVDSVYHRVLKYSQSQYIWDKEDIAISF